MAVIHVLFEISVQGGVTFSAGGRVVQPPPRLYLDPPLNIISIWGNRAIER